MENIPVSLKVVIRLVSSFIGMAQAFRCSLLKRGTGSIKSSLFTH